MTARGPAGPATKLSLCGPAWPPNCPDPQVFKIPPLPGHLGVPVPPAGTHSFQHLFYY